MIVTIRYRRAINKRLLAIGAAAMTAAAAFGEVIYENDFAMRTSTGGVVPMTEWRTYDYVTGFLANTNGAAPFAETANVMQDGWIKVPDNTNGNVYCENAMVWAGVSKNDNPAAVLGRNNTANASSCAIKQRLGNTFTNGILTAQFDFKSPEQWVSYGESDTLRRVSVSFGDERFYSPDVSQEKIYRYTACGVGAALHGPEGGRLRKVWYNDNMNFANSNRTEQAMNRYAWHRAVVTIDLDARTWGFSMYEMGTSQPALDDATPASAVCATNNLPFSDDSVTSISSIALVGVGVCWGNNSYNASTAPTHVAWFDNIRIHHNEELCYENDFATRRWRIFGGTPSHTYVADCLATNSVGNEVYVVGQNIVPARVNNGTTVQPEGIDRWRRVNKDGTGDVGVRSDSNGTYMRFDLSRSGTTKNFYAFVAQPLESTVSSGKLKFSVDARLPTSSYWKYQSGFASLLWVTLGSASYYAGDPNNFSTYRWAPVGIRAQADGNYVTHVPTSGDSVNNLPDTGSISAGTWYRIVIEADVDAKKYVYKVYDKGTSVPQSDTDGTLIYTSPVIPRKDSINTISSFSLAAYYCPVYFDNIKISHTPTGSESETLLYENDFTTRKIYAQETRVAPLVGKLRLNPEGQDNWTRVYNTERSVFIDWADSNPAVTFARDGSDIWAVQDIGQTVKKGLLVAQADIRPPKGWFANGGSTYVRLGGDALRQSPMSKAAKNYFLNNIAMGFGFKNTNSGKSGNLYTNSTIAAFCGDLNSGGAMTNAEYDVDTTHWYRFVATTAVTKNQYDVSVYDMGTEHPTLASPTPAEPVVTFTELPFRRTKADLGGISCISVSGHRAPQSMYDQSLEPLIDNLRVSHTLFGLKISIK